MGTRAEVSLLADLVKTPSLSGKESCAATVFSEWLPGLGWERIEIDAVGNVVARRGKGAKELILLGHIDTVPGGPSFAFDEYRLQGRGSVDAKGPLCCFAVAGGDVHIPDSWSITLIAAVGEESDSRGIRHRIKFHTPSACIVGEPTGADGVVVAYRGRLLVRLSAQDAGGHRSWNAGPMTATVLAAGEIIGSFESIDGRKPGLCDSISGAVLSMAGSEKHGRAAEIDLDIRIPSSKSPETVAAVVRSHCSPHDVEISILDSVPPHHVSGRDPVAGSLRSAIRLAGLKPRLLRRSGTADFNIAAEWGCHMAVYGPGDAFLEHTEAEEIDLGKYLLSISVLRRAIGNIFHIIDR